MNRKARTRLAFGLLLAATTVGAGLLGRSARGDAASDAAAAAAASRPGLHLESGIVLADGGTIHVLGAPLVGPGGQVAQRLDVTLHLAGEPGGTLRVDRLEAAPTVLSLRPAEQFVPGVYLSTDGTKYTLRGPAVSVGGRTTWSFTFTAVAKEENKPITWDSTWTTGTAIGNPDLANQPDPKTLPPGFAYGVLTYARIGIGYSYHSEGHVLIGARQIGDSLQVAIFDHGGPTWVQHRTLLYTPQH